MNQLKNKNTTENNPITLDDAINFVNQREHNDKLSKVEIFFTERIQDKELSNEEKAQSMYYLLRCKLRRNVLFETEDLISLYHRMHDTFLKTETELWNEYSKNKKNPIYKTQLNAFYHLTHYYFGTLETIYNSLNFDERATKILQDKMKFKQKYSYYVGRYSKWIGYQILEITSNYGTSFLRWGITGILSVFLFAVIFAITDSFLLISEMMVPNHEPFSDYFYYSIVTFTTLGYGDIVPVHIIHKIFASIEVVIGYFMLGIFVSLLNKKI